MFLFPCKNLGNSFGRGSCGQASGGFFFGGGGTLTGPVAVARPNDSEFLNCQRFEVSPGKNREQQNSFFSA